MVKVSFVVLFAVIAFILLCMSGLFVWQANWLAAAFTVLGGLYVALKAMQLSTAKIRLHDRFFTYGKKKIPYASVTKISSHQVPRYTSPTLWFHPLGNSVIYTVLCNDKAIQILGKFYLDAEVFMKQIAEKANIEIASD